MLITTKDNNLLELTIEQQEYLDDLRWMCASTLEELSGSDNSRLLIFPADFNKNGDKIGKERVFEVYGNRLITGNIMGFVGRGNTMVKIQSRFACDKGRDYFLHYMLQKVFAINLFDLKHQSDEESIFDFLIYLFPSFLKRALRQGLFREYQTHRYNETNIRGRIDMNRHIKHNIPFAGNVAYSTREYAKNNHVTQLIRHTVEYISSHPFSGNILKSDDKTKESVRIIREATPNYNRNERRSVINANLRPLHHPYYVEYRHLQRLCLQILRHEELKYGHDDNEIYGILFDGAWLWEEYLHTFLGSVLIHSRNRLNEGGQHLFKKSAGVIYPDFYNQMVVLDAKYKGYNNWDLQRPDLYQVISYMHVMEKQYGGFIVPVMNQTTPRTLKGYGGKLSVYGMDVNTKETDFSKFQEVMRLKEIKLLDEIKTECV